MNARQVRQITQEWVTGNLDHYPGLVAAHLVGGITTTPHYAPFPSYKDVDFHMIFAPGSPALKPLGPFLSNVEVLYKGLMLEGGMKPMSEYQSAAAALANPEIAHHLMVDQSILYDPTGMLQALRKQVSREFARRDWVRARIEHERRGLQGALANLPMARAGGGSGEVLLGYTFTFLTALLCVATLRPPSTGSQASLRMCEVLAEANRLELYEEALATLGVAKTSRARVEQFLREGIEAFDLAVTIKHSPHPAGHKLHAHLRPYFVESCQSLMQEGRHREALYWLILFHLSACDVILMDGPDAQKPKFAAYAATFLEEIGMDSQGARAARWEQATRLYDRFFALAEEIINQHPDIVD
jgi:hypothetical protein